MGPLDKESLMEVSTFMDHAAMFDVKIRISTEYSQY